MAIRVIHQADGFATGLIQAIGNAYAAQAANGAVRATKKAAKRQGYAQIGKEIFGAVDSHLRRKEAERDDEKQYQREIETDVRKSKLRREEQAQIGADNEERALALENRRGENAIKRDRERFEMDMEAAQQERQQKELMKRLGNYRAEWSPEKRAQLGAIREEIHEVDMIMSTLPQGYAPVDYESVREALEQKALEIQPDFVWEDPAERPTFKSLIEEGRIIPHPESNWDRGFYMDKDGNLKPFDHTPKPQKAEEQGPVGPWTQIGIDEDKWNKMADSVAERLQGENEDGTPGAPVSGDVLVRETMAEFQRRGYQVPQGAVPQGGPSGAGSGLVPAGSDTGGGAPAPGLDEAKARAASSAPVLIEIGQLPQNRGRPPADP